MQLSGHSASAIETKAPLVRAALRTPRAAAVAGIIFSLLLISLLWLLHLSVPPDPLDVGECLRVSSNRVSLALNLVPFAGGAFMWFLGVLRGRLGVMEDKFFATVFLGMIFIAAAAASGLSRAYAAAPAALSDSFSFTFALARSPAT
jgi:hypothetical protein